MALLLTSSIILLKFNHVCICVFQFTGVERLLNSKSCKLNMTTSVQIKKGGKILYHNFN